MWTDRTELLLGSDGLSKLQSAKVLVVGAGGVGGVAAEMLARAGVGSITVIDNDTVSDTNRNRQILALCSTLGKPKCEVLRERLLDINPALKVETVSLYLLSNQVEDSAIPDESSKRVSEVLSEINPDYVVDAIDTLGPKISLIQYCLEHQIPMVSSMGSGAKLDATSVRIADISESRQCPLAHMLRKRLHKIGIHTGFQVVFSVELPKRESVILEESRNKKSQVGTISYLPAVFGCACAQAAIIHIVGIR